ncbi:hypothetical protein GCM10007921_32840 [Tritonibacter mobilis]|nr:hypothetical protein GCM10007921_32840 [Tritonibacter mobilis]
MAEKVSANAVVDNRAAAPTRTEERTKRIEITKLTIGCGERLLLRTKKQEAPPWDASR